MASVTQQDNLTIKVANIESLTAEEKTILRKKFLRKSILDAVIVQDDETVTIMQKVISVSLDKGANSVFVETSDNVYNCGAIQPGDYEDGPVAVTPSSSIQIIDGTPVPFNQDISSWAEGDPFDVAHICEGTNLESVTVDDFNVIFTVNGTDVSQPIEINEQTENNLDLVFGKKDGTIASGDVIDIRVEFKGNLIYSCQGTVA